MEHLLNEKQNIRVIVRSLDKIPESWKNNDQLSIIQASVSQLTINEMTEFIQGCQAVASCLDHNLNLKGIYGNPRRLVTEAVNLICDAITKNAADKPVKFILMNTSGNRNSD